MLTVLSTTKILPYVIGFVVVPVMNWPSMLSICSLDGENEKRLNEPCRATVGGVRKGNKLNESSPMKPPLLKRPVMSTFIVELVGLGSQCILPVMV